MDVIEVSIYVDELFLENQPLDARYSIVANLGSGGSATVYLVEDRELGSLCAWKVQRALGDQRASLQKEVLVLQTLQHPNIIKVFGYHQFEDLQLIALSLEYLSGGSLRDRITYAPFTEREARSLATDILKGLHYLHQRGLLHRDIKPDNILFGSDDTAKLADFGLARELSHPNHSTLQGSLLYLAPEVLDGKTPSPQTDLYAFGLTLYEALTGTPYTSAEISGLSSKRIPQVQRRKLTRLTISQPLKNLLTSLLAPNPADRPATAEDALSLLTAEVDSNPHAKSGWFIAAATIFLTLLVLLSTAPGKLLFLRTSLHLNHFFEYPVSSQTLERITRTGPNLFLYLVKRRELQLAELALAADSAPAIDEQLLTELVVSDSSVPLLRKVLSRVTPSQEIVRQLLKLAFNRRDSESILLLLRLYPGEQLLYGPMLFDRVPAWRDLIPELLKEELEPETRAVLTAFLNDEEFGRILSSPIHRWHGRSAEGLTSLHYAATLGPLSTSFILTENLPVDSTDSAGRTPLHLAVHHNQFESAKALLEAGANVNRRDNKLTTPLWYAVQNGSAELTKLLLDNGATVDSAGTPGVSLAVDAALQGKTKILQLLLEADPQSLTYGSEDLTSIGVAVLKGDRDSVRLLLTHGANPNASTMVSSVRRSIARTAIIHWNGFLLDDILSAGANLQEISSEGRTLLEEAWQARCLVAIDVLIRHGTRIDTPANRHVFEQALKSSQHFILWEPLTKAVDFSSTMRFTDGKTALELAIAAKNSRAIIRLLELDGNCTLNAQQRATLEELVPPQFFSQWVKNCSIQQS